MQTYKQLTYEQRCQIYALKNIGKSQQVIAEQIGINQSSIPENYSAIKANKVIVLNKLNTLCCDQRKNSMEARKMTVELITVVYEKIQEKWSPEQISGWLCVTINQQISHETLYKHIWVDKKLGVNCLPFCDVKARLISRTARV